MSKIQNRIKEIEKQLLSNKIIRIPYGSEKFTQELKNRILQHNSDIAHNKKYIILSDYINSTDKIAIRCPNHGDFLQTYFHHMKGIGCPKCGINKRINNLRLTQEQAIENMTKKHNDRYTYPKFAYTTAHDKSFITCYKHGDFFTKLC